MATTYRFRVTSGVGTSGLAVGPKSYVSGQEFTLTSDQAKEWIDKRMFDSGYIMLVEELGGDEPQKWNSTAANTVSGKAGQISDRFHLDFGLEQKYVGLSTTFGVGATTGLATLYVEEDCVFESVQVPNVALTGSGNTLDDHPIPFNVMRVPNGDGTAAGMLEYPGTGSLLSSHSATQASGSTPSNVTVAANGPSTSGTFDLGYVADNAEWLYVGYFDKFDGVYFDIAQANDVAASVTVEYAQVTTSGTTQWTTANSITDGTDNSGASWGQDGSITFARPGDWGKRSLSSQASGSADLYYVRFGNVGTTALAATATANQVWPLSRHLRPKDNNSFCEKGDMVRIDQMSGSGAFGGTSTYYTGATNLVLSFRSLR